MRDEHGILFPSSLPSFHRVPAPEELAHLVRWFWIPEWNLPPGESSRQEILPFPACNLTVQPADVGLAVGLSGPATRISHRELTRRGWAVGALLRPAAVGALGIEPAALRDREVPFVAPGLHEVVAAAMAAEQGRAAPRPAAPAPAEHPATTAAHPAAETTVDRYERAARAYGDWLAAHATEPEPGALVANDLEDAIRSDRTLVQIDQVARLLGLSTRSLQRLALKYIGLPPLAIIRRYRLQEAVLRLREQPDLTIAQIAAELGYADQAHLSADFRTVLGFAPGTYRRGTRGPR